MDFTASDVLLKAASRIEEEGMWCRRFWYDMSKAPPEAETNYQGFLHQLSEGLNELGVRVPECAQGAMASAIVELVGHFDRSLFEQADNRLFEHVGSTVANWNDSAKSAHDVAEAMRRAAL